MKSYEIDPHAEVETEDSTETVEGSLAHTEVDAIDEVYEVSGLVDTVDSAPVTHEKQEEDESVEERRRSRFVLPPRDQLLTWVAFGGVVLLGAILRFWGLGDKPLHHDESLHAYYSLQLLHNMENWIGCFAPGASCYQYNPLLHGPFQFHFIALVYKISQLVGAPDNGVNTTTVRILAATLGTGIVFLPYFLRDYLGKIGAWIACFLLAVSPSIVYFSRFAREDIYMAFFTLLMVVAIARYVRDRKMYWLIIGAAAFSFSYATKEATFLSVAVFGSFVAGLICWELGLRWKLHWQLRWKLPENFPFQKFFRNAAPLTLLAYLLVAAIAAKYFFAWIKALSIYVTTHTSASDIYVQNLKNNTVLLVPWLGILLGIYVLSILGREMFGKVSTRERRGLAAKIDPKNQRLLDTILTMPWTHWFFSLLVAWAIFLVLFTVLFTNIRGGIGDGIWQGLYYWLQQQQVARGGQPWYYYLLLIPLYEQVGVVFGIVGLIRCIARPTRFRLFVLYWFVGNLVLYSWAAEKMPWLMIHITMPMMIVAAIGLEPIVVTLISLVKDRAAQFAAAGADINEPDSLLPVVVAPRPRPRVSVLTGATAVFGIVMAVLLLLPTLQNMYEVSYVHAADGPHEMMVYVQTTPDVNTIMAKVDALDQKYYGGKHQMPIGLTDDATWPFAWYVRDYTSVCFSYPTGCPTWSKNIPVIITGGDNLYTNEAQYSTGNGKDANYFFHQYHMRTWWDEGYKPPPCVPSKTVDCTGQPTYGGVGPWLWLSYGDAPPVGAKFNLGLAAQHIWQWWWQRRAFGDTGGSYDMGLFIRKDLTVGVTP